MTEAHIPLGPLRLALVDLTGAPDDHLVRIEITEDRVFLHARGANPEKGLMEIRKTFEIERRNLGEDAKELKALMEERGAFEHEDGTCTPEEVEFHEETPPVWVPPQLIRMWDKCTPEQRRAMKEELERLRGDTYRVEKEMEKVLSKVKEEETTT